MIEITTGDILSAGTDALVNTVNCVGIMGRGIALQFKNAYPANFKAYEAACKRQEVQPGRMFVQETGKFSPRFIINFPTKRHWRGKSRIEDVESGLIDLVAQIRKRGIRSIAIPPLGAGLGGLNWADVRPLIEAALAELPDLAVKLYEPGGAPAADRMAKSTDVPRMTVGRAALVRLVQQYLGGLLDPLVTLIEVHKLMYFLQEAGQPLRLTYVKAPYGPYAENLRHVLSKIEGHFLAGYADGGDEPTKQLALVAGAVDEAAAFLKTDREALDRFDRVADLVDGFETPFGLELLSTVHWVVTREQARSSSEVVGAVHEWNPRKGIFSERQIMIAVNTLQSKGWLKERMLTEEALSSEPLVPNEATISAMRDARAGIGMHRVGSVAELMASLDDDEE